MPCFFKFVSWMRAKDLTMTAQPPRCLGSNATGRTSRAARHAKTTPHATRHNRHPLTRVLSAGALAVVLIPDNHPLQARSLATAQNGSTNAAAAVRLTL